MPGPRDRDGLSESVRFWKSRLEEDLTLGGAPNDCKVSSRDTDGAICIFECTGGAAGPRHLHHDQDEWIYVVDGEIDLVLGTERLRLCVGESVFIPRKVGHVWGSNGRPSRVIEALARTVAVLGPGGDSRPDVPWPRLIAIHWSGPRIGGTFTTAEPKDRELYNPEKFGTVALLVRAGRQSGDPELIRAGDEMIQAILHQKGDVLPLSKIEGQTLTRLHAAVALSAMAPR